MNSLVTRLSAILLLVLVCAAQPMSSYAAVVYTFGPANFHPNGTTITGGTITNPDGSVSVQANCTGAGYHDLIVVTGKLLSGHPYLATLTYRTVTSPFPTSFYMHSHSHNLGAASDTWQNFLGEPGVQRVVRLPMTLTSATDWVFYVGCNGPGSIIIDSFTVQDGTGYAYTAAATSGSPSNTPLGTPLPTGSPAITIEPPAPTTTITLNAASYGLVADGSTPVSTTVAKANYTAITNAIAACKTQHAATLIIPTGTYRIWSSTWILMQSVTDLVIDGQGSTFIFENLTSNGYAIDVLTCTRCVIKNLKLDWDWSVKPIGSLGTVVAVAPDSLSADITFPDLNAAQTSLVAASNWMSMQPMDPTTLRLTSNANLKPTITSFTTVNANTLHVTFSAAVPLVANQSYRIRHLYYDMAAFRVEGSSHILFDTIRIYSMPGMGWLTRGNTSNWKLHSCTIAPGPGSRNPFSTAADGFHIYESLGNLVLDTCSFSQCGDDNVNLHDICFEGVTRTSSNVLTLNGNANYYAKFNIGDTIELDNADYSPLGYTSIVQNVQYGGTSAAPTTILTLADTLPATVLAQDIIWNHHYNTANVYVTHCTFTGGGRGMLIGAQNMTVEYTTFDHNYSAGIKFHTDIAPGLWQEGHGASNVILRYNVFNSDNARGQFDSSTIYINPVLLAGPSNYALFHDILIDSNTVLDCAGAFVSINGAGNVTVKNNSIKRSVDLPNMTTMSGCLFAAYASNVSLGGNTWKASPAPVCPGEMIDPLSTSNVLAGQNVVAP